MDAPHSARVQLDILGAGRPKLLNVVVDLLTGAQLKLFRIALAFIRPAIARVELHLTCAGPARGSNKSYEARGGSL